jgi:hypothetical protein
MRETQMKKIIAAAVAAAFVAPAFASDVTVSGDVEYFFISGNSGKTYSDSGDQDVVVSGSSDIGNGLTATASLELDGSDSDLNSDSSLTIAGSFGSVAVGDAVDTAIEAFDEKSDKAEQGGTSGDNAIGDTHTMLLKPAVGVEGLDLALSYSTTTASATSAKTITSYAAQYTMGGITVAYGVADKEETDAQQSSTGVGFAVGPISVGYEAIQNDGFVEDTDQTNVGVAYNYGQGNIFFETGEVDVSGTKTETTAYGISYKMGAVNLYVLNNEVDTTTDTEDTYVGVEYAF